MSAQERLGGLIMFQTRAKPLAESGFKAVHGGLGERAAVITDSDLPIRSPKEPSLLDGAIALDPVVPGMEYRARAWRGDQTCVMPLGRGVAHAPVVSAVANGDGAGSRPCDVQHGTEHLTVVLLAGGDAAGDHERGDRIDAEMDFPIRAALQTMNGGQPGAGTTDLESGGIDDDAAAGLRPGGQRDARPPAAERGRIWNGQRTQPGEVEHRAEQAHRLRSGSR